jgi:bifunctional non-homologous end joining protein LigD
METLPVKTLPRGEKWTYEVKLDGFRMEAIRSDSGVVLYSRRRKSMTAEFREIAKALEYLPPGTIIDGEVVALDEHGIPKFNLLQNFRSGEARLTYFAFDILSHMGRDVTGLPLFKRRPLLLKVIRRSNCIDVAEWTTGMGLGHLTRFVAEWKLEGIVAKQIDSLYESGKRTGAWVKLRLNKRQEFVIGGYTPSHLGVDALLVGFYAGKELRFAGAVRAGLIPATRRWLHEEINVLEVQKCPFANLPDKRLGAWGQGMTAEKMKNCRWLKPRIAAEIEFTEWTPEDRLRGAAFVGLRYDKDARKVIKET